MGDLERRITDIEKLMWAGTNAHGEDLPLTSLVWPPDEPRPELPAKVSARQRCIYDQLCAMDGSVPAEGGAD
jgi:hypothetical protein